MSQKSKSSSYFSLPPKAVQEGKRLSEIYIEERKDKQSAPQQDTILNETIGAPHENESKSVNRGQVQKGMSDVQKANVVNGFEKLTREALHSFIREIPKTGKYYGFEFLNCLLN